MGWREAIARALYEWDAGINPEPSRPWPEFREHDLENAAFYETFAGCAHQGLLAMPPADRIALARELLKGTEPPGEWGALLDEARVYVRDKPQWQRWIDGTPMDNDVPVWMADFALMVLRRFACRAAMMEGEE